MKRPLKARILLVLAVLAASVFYALPSAPFFSRLPDSARRFFPSRTINLGLDLQGGMHLVLEIDIDSAIMETASNYASDARRMLAGEGIRVDSVQSDPEHPRKIKIVLQDPRALSSAYELVSSEFSGWEVERIGGDSLVMAMPRSEAENIQSAIQRQALATIRNRVDEFGVAEPSIQPEGRNRLVIQLPGMQDPQRARELVGRTARLTFHIALTGGETRELLSRIDRHTDAGIEPFLRPMDTRGQPLVRSRDIGELMPELSREDVLQMLPAGFIFALGQQEFLDGAAYQPLYVMRERQEIGGEMLRNAYVGFHAMETVVNIEFNRRGAILFERITRENIEKPLAIVLDGIVQSAPIIRSEIPRTSTGHITGRFTSEEASDLAIMLRAGALPASINVAYEQTVGPSLGRDSVEKGIKAVVWGAVLVLAFMAAYYLACGLIADFALCLNLVIILGALAGLGATLTLPGIAGMILITGMSVDANVLIFERIREELAGGRTIRMSIKNGFSKALITILDANITTMIAALVLFQFGTGPVRGFAVTLSIGILASMFTAIVVTRLVLDLLAERKNFTGFRMLGILKNPRFNFLGARKYSLALSLLIITAGLVSITARGSGNLGIDFAGGTLMVRNFSEPVSTDRVRASLAEIGLETSIIQDFDAGRGMLIRIPGEEEKAPLVDARLQESFPSLLKDPFTHGQTNYVGPVVGRDLARQAMLAVFFSLLGIVVYISWRFQFKFAMAALAALVHDVLITAGLFSLTGRDITLPVIAALLTIIGYSLNDTIVVFDRIREDMHLMRREKFSNIINLSINQTLSRTILTSLTTFAVVMCLFVLGGETIKDFAFAILVGIAAGTYSSIFVASPLLLAWHKDKHG